MTIQLERKLALERVRSRIAMDLHDDLGASLARVAVVSEVLKSNVSQSDAESQLMLSPEVLLPVIDKLNLTQDKSYTAGYAGDGSTLRDWFARSASTASTSALTGLPCLL